MLKLGNIFKLYLWQIWKVYDKPVRQEYQMYRFMFHKNSKVFSYLNGVREERGDRVVYVLFLGRRVEGPVEGQGEGGVGHHFTGSSHGLIPVV